MAEDTAEGLKDAIRVDTAELRGHVDAVVRASVEETLNALLQAEADQICKAGRYERSPERVDTRAGVRPGARGPRAEEASDLGVAGGGAHHLAAARPADVPAATEGTVGDGGARGNHPDRGSGSCTGEGQAGEGGARRDRDRALGSPDTYYVGNLKGVGSLRPNYRIAMICDSVTRNFVISVSFPNR